jgi:hypothetical protein
LDILTCALQHYRFLQRENNRTIAQGVPAGWRNNAYQSQQEKYSFGGFEFLVEYKNENGTLHISFADKNFILFKTSSIPNAVILNLFQENPDWHTI